MDYMYVSMIKSEPLLLSLFDIHLIGIGVGWGIFPQDVQKPRHLIYIVLYFSNYDRMRGINL
jgi:hypothetical protein